MSVQQTARQRVRAAMIADIKTMAREQVATNGAASLSLRAIARELGMVSSAIYRYFPSRDELLTELIIDSYEALGASVEEADATAGRRADHMDRWVRACWAIRGWAVDNPHEYALLYGSPVPGYRAPQDTVPAATRVTAVLAGIVREAVAAGGLSQPHPGGRPLPPSLAADASGLGEALMPGVPEEVVTRCLLAWVAAFGLISFELFGHLNNVVSDYGEGFDHQVRELGRYVGLT